MVTMTSIVGTLTSPAVAHSGACLPVDRSNQTASWIRRPATLARSPAALQEAVAPPATSPRDGCQLHAVLRSGDCGISVGEEHFAKLRSEMKMPPGKLKSVEVNEDSAAALTVW